MIIQNFMVKSDITKITGYANAFVARSHNKRITYTLQKDGNILIECIRILSKEEQENLKDSPGTTNQFVIRGKAFVTQMLFAPTTLENIRVLLNVINDVGIDKLKIEN
jgi:hypothetical protein